MHAYIITGSNKSERNRVIHEWITKWNVQTIDIVTISDQEETLGINHVREFQKRLFLVPYQSSYTVGIINDMHRLTTEAQHALLKTLEEPPPHVRIIGETKQPYVLLPTILSRCEHITLRKSESYTKEELSQLENTIEHILHASIGKRMNYVDEITSTKDEAKKWVEQAIASRREHLFSSDQAPTFLRNLLTAKDQLEANVNPKLVLDMVFL